MIPPGMPSDGVAKWTTFLPPQDTTTTRGWQAWVKPEGCNWIFVYIQAAGGGGGNGFTGAAGTARGGGGGGGSGGLCKLFIPAHMLPDRLFVRPGAGGAAAAAGVTSYIAIEPNTTAQNLIASIAGGGAGGTGTGAAAGAAGAAGAATALSPFASHGLALSVAGNAGALGGAQTGAVGASVTPPTGATSPTTGGAGGGGTPIANTNFAGGTIVAAGPWLLTPGGLAAGGAGVSGLEDAAMMFKGMVQPVFHYGGTGGGTNGAAGTGGAGGKGGYGCGGGGGGAAVTGGAGGRGGHGFIIIGAF